MWLRGHPRVNVAKLGPEPGLRLPFSKDRKILPIRRLTGCAGLARKVLFPPKDKVMATLTLVGTELSNQAASHPQGFFSKSGPAVEFELFAVFKSFQRCPLEFCAWGPGNFWEFINTGIGKSVPRGVGHM